MSIQEDVFAPEALQRLAGGGTTGMRIQIWQALKGQQTEVSSCALPGRGVHLALGPVVAPPANLQRPFGTQ